MTDTDVARTLLDAASGDGPRAARATVIEGPDDLPRGTSSILLADGKRLGNKLLGELSAEALRDALDGGRRGTISLTHNGEQVGVYIEVAEPELELIVVGGGHIGRSLSYIGAHVGFRVTVVDDRADYANPERFPEADQVICEDFATAIAKLPLGPTSSVVIVTRGHKQDELALSLTAGSSAGYVGMIGSKRRVGAVFQHLEESGVSAQALARVHSPIGIDIGSETPEEIAVSIIAEIIAERRKKQVRTLSAGRRRS